MAYTTKSNVDNLYGVSIPQATFDTLLASVKAFIDRYCGKTFEAASETRYYDGNGKRSIVIDSFVGTPTVVILNSDGTEDRTLTMGQDSDFITAPYNSTEKHELILTGNGWYGCFPHGRYRLKVTASFGASSAVPKTIELAATQLIGGLYGGGAGGSVKSETLGDYSVTYDGISDLAGEMGVTNLLDAHRDIDI